MHTVVRHTLLVRITHWITTACFLALLVSGTEIVISHPRFYWGETGNVMKRWLFDLPIPASRSRVNTGKDSCCQTKTVGAAHFTFRRLGCCYSLAHSIRPPVC